MFLKIHHTGKNAPYFPKIGTTKKQLFNFVDGEREMCSYAYQMDIKITDSKHTD